MAIERSLNTLSFGLALDLRTGKVRPDLFEFSATTPDHRQGATRQVPRSVVETVLQTGELQVVPDLSFSLLYVPELGVYRGGFSDHDNIEDPSENTHADLEKVTFEDLAGKMLSYRDEGEVLS